MGNTILVVGGSRIGSWWWGLRSWGGGKSVGAESVLFGFFLRGQAEGCRGRKTGTKKPAQVAGFFGSESLVETFRYCYMVPEGDSSALYNPWLAAGLYG